MARAIDKISVVARLDRDSVTYALQASNGNISKAAKLLDCTRLTLQRRMRDYGFARGKAGRPKRRLHYRRHRGLYALGAAAAGLALYSTLRRRGSST